MVNAGAEERRESVGIFVAAGTEIIDDLIF